MAGFTRSAFIARPTESVFDFATDLANASIFLPGVTKVELLTEGGIKPGARFRETRRVGTKERTAVIEIVEHRRPELHAASAAMLGMRATYRFRFSSEGGGTRVNMDASVQGNLLWQPFLGMITRMMEKEDGKYLSRLKEAMERM
jgi:carbon monoxide dehydrogenase subunit G